jgi:hypothetical protein
MVLKWVFGKLKRPKRPRSSSTRNAFCQGVHLAADVVAQNERWLSAHSFADREKDLLRFALRNAAALMAICINDAHSQR